MDKDQGNGLDHELQEQLATTGELEAQLAEEKKKSDGPAGESLVDSSWDRSFFGDEMLNNMRELKKIL